MGFELPGLWDIGTSNDLSTVAAVSYPIEGPGRVGVIQNGEPAWEQPLENAAAWSVDVSEDGQYIVVGCIHVDDGLERTGQPGVRVFSAAGELLWSHETEEDVLSTGVNEDSDVVVASTDDLSTFAFDLEGNSRWEHNDTPTMEQLSDDGSTIIASPPVTTLGSGDGATIWESNIGNAAGLGDPFSSSADGSRVAISTIDFELVVLEEGDSIWEQQNEAGPYYSALSEDGSTLAAMEIDNDAQSADLVGYRI
ncbi:outer membrane protein assembly factor BamB family protein [Halovivax ruber]|uniref:outer membrane protein assembly factor BamB family protein n=1 Tax=Halovivax ruber TaxID=387341 RepID=UPI0011E55476|nr:PQQ-binding-like beta-propeller repeat protein [Halovivax ruber]